LSRPTFVPFRTQFRSFDFPLSVSLLLFLPGLVCRICVETQFPHYSHAFRFLDNTPHAFPFFFVPHFTFPGTFALWAGPVLFFGIFPSYSGTGMVLFRLHFSARNPPSFAPRRGYPLGAILTLGQSVCPSPFFDNYLFSSIIPVSLPPYFYLCSRSPLLSSRFFYQLSHM